MAMVHVIKICITYQFLFFVLAPSSPLSFSYKELAPNNFHGPRINLTWSRPAESNGIIRNYIVFYANQEGETKQSVGGDTFSYLVDVLGGVTYHFYIGAVTVKPGQNVSLSVKTNEYGMLCHRN